jgi:hypothetical protein
MSLSGTTQVFVRGATVQFATNFYDVNGNLIQPDAATINILPSSATTPITITMTPPSGSVTTWTALCDTRGQSAPQIVYWSIHTGSSDPIPVVAEDGQFQLSANPANLASF